MQKYHFITSDQKDIKIYKEYLKNSATLNDLSEEYKLDKGQPIPISFTYEEMKSFKENLQFEKAYNETDLKIVDFLNIKNTILSYRGNNKKLYSIDLDVDLDKECEKFKKYMEENPSFDKHYYEFIINFGMYTLTFIMDNTIFDEHIKYAKILTSMLHKNSGFNDICSSYAIKFDNNRFIIWDEGDDLNCIFYIPALYNTQVINMFKFLYKLTHDEYTKYKLKQ